MLGDLPVPYTRSLALHRRCWVDVVVIVSHDAQTSGGEGANGQSFQSS